MPTENTRSQMSFSARAHDRILRAARTIADLIESPDVSADHLLKAIGYRILDRTLFVKLTGLSLSRTTEVR